MFDEVKPVVSKFILRDQYSKIKFQNQKLIFKKAKLT